MEQKRQTRLLRTTVANLGEQPVKKKEIMLTGDETDEETFGYQEAWADYRMKPNRVSGKM